MDTDIGLIYEEDTLPRVWQEMLNRENTFIKKNTRGIAIVQDLEHIPATIL